MKHLIVCVAVLFLGLGSLAPARAHTAIGSSGFYNVRWKVDLYLPYRFASNYPAGEWRDKINYGRGAWNGVGEPLQWAAPYADVADFPYNSCPSTFERNVIHWADISAAGRVFYCVFGNDHSRLWATQMAIDSVGVNWYTGSSEPAWNQTDLWSVATHEWGHMSGSLTNGDGCNCGHWWESDNTILCNGDATRHTMCPAVPAGTSFMFSLEAHDKHTFAAAY